MSRGYGIGSTLDLCNRREHLTFRSCQVEPWLTGDVLIEVAYIDYIAWTRSLHLHPYSSLVPGLTMPHPLYH